MERPSFSLKVNILAIDDDWLIRECIANVLELAGHQVTVVGSGKEGIAHFRKDDYDLVITDLDMPEMDGWDVARAIRGINPVVPVIMVTGWADRIEQQKLRDTGVARLVA